MAFSFSQRSAEGVSLMSSDQPQNGRRTFLQSLAVVVTTTTTTTGALVAQQPSPANAAEASVSDPVTSILPESPPLPPTGLKAPNFSLPSSRNTETTTKMSLKDLTKSGKWTVLYFYPAAFSQGCTLEARNFQRDLAEYRQAGAQIVGVSVDPPEKNANFCSSEALDFYMLSDAGGQVSRLYGSALSVPGFGTFSNRQTYLIDPQGNLRYVFTNVEKNIMSHSSDVLAKLKEFTA